jgi:hypothetical protein
MPVREVKRYAELFDEGDDTMFERRALLENHRQRILENLRELNKNLEAIEYKIAFYKDLEAQATGEESESVIAG